MDDDMTILLTCCVIFIIVAICCYFGIYKYRTQSTYSQEELLELD